MCRSTVLASHIQAIVSMNMRGCKNLGQPGSLVPFRGWTLGLFTWRSRTVHAHVCLHRHLLVRGIAGSPRIPTHHASKGVDVVALVVLHMIDARHQLRRQALCACSAPNARLQAYSHSGYVWMGRSGHISALPSHRICA